MVRLGTYTAEIDLMNTPMRVEDTFMVVFFIEGFYSRATRVNPSEDEWSVTGWQGYGFKTIPSLLEDYIKDNLMDIIEPNEIEWD